MSKQQKVAVVTGASQGIGAGLVRALRQRNYRVVATSRSIKPSDDPGILAIAGDIGAADTARRVVSEGLERFGRIDLLVNNAGIFIAKPFTQYTEEDFVAKISTNVAGFFHVTKAVVEAMEADDLPLETLLAKYEEGAKLVKICQEKLAEAELKIQRLEKDAAGELKLKPIETVIEA